MLKVIQNLQINLKKKMQKCSKYSNNHTTKELPGGQRSLATHCQRNKTNEVGLEVAVLFAFVCVASVSANQNALTEEGKTILIDGGSTDAFGLVDIFIYFGTFTLALITAMILIGLFYGVTGSSTTTTGYEQTGYAESSYASPYEQAYSVARALYDGYKKYEEGRSAKE